MCHTSHLFPVPGNCPSHLTASIPPKARIPQELQNPGYRVIYIRLSLCPGHSCCPTRAPCLPYRQPNVCTHPFPPSPCCCQSPKAASGHVSEPFLHSHSADKAVSVSLLASACRLTHKHKTCGSRLSGSSASSQSNVPQPYVIKLVG